VTIAMPVRRRLTADSVASASFKIYGGKTMHRTRVAIGVLGLVVAAGSAFAATPTSVTLFGQKYNVTVHSLAGTYITG